MSSSSSATRNQLLSPFIVARCLLTYISITETFAALLTDREGTATFSLRAWKSLCACNLNFDRFPRSYGGTRIHAAALRNPLGREFKRNFSSRRIRSRSIGSWLTTTSRSGRDRRFQRDRTADRDDLQRVSFDVTEIHCISTARLLCSIEEGTVCERMFLVVLVYCRRRYRAILTPRNEQLTERKGGKKRS